MSIATTDGSEYWIAGGEEPASTYGISYYNDALLAPVNVVPGSNDFGRIQIWGGKFYFIDMASTGTTSKMYRLESPPRAQIGVAPAPLFQGTSTGWRDFDIFSHSRIIVGGVQGLELWDFNAAISAWVPSFFAEKLNIVGVGVSVDRATVYVSTAANDGTVSAVYAWDVATQAYTNNGTALLVAPLGVQFRGVAPAPIPPSSTPTTTPSSSVSPSTTPSSSVTASITPSASSSPSSGASQTPSPSQTGSPTSTTSPSTTATSSATATASPTSSITSMGTPYRPNNFVVVIIGDGAAAVPNFGNGDLLVPASYAVYGECGSGCAQAPLERTVALSSTIAPDRYGNRVWTLNSGSYCLPFAADLGRCRATFRQGRLVPSGDRSTLISGGYDANAGYSLTSSKREPSMLRIQATGYWNVSLPCKVPRAGASAAAIAAGDNFYCNGFDGNEIPMAIASEDGETGFWNSGGEEPASTYGLRYFTAAQGTNFVSIGIADRNDYERVQVFGGRLWFMQKNEGTNSEMYRLSSLPTQAVAKPVALFAQTGGAAFNWNDFDLVEPTPGATVVWAASASGLLSYAVNAATGAWTQTFFGGPTDLISVGVSNDKSTVYCVVANNTFSAAFSFDVGTSTWNNNGAPILTPPRNRQFRGIAPAPIIPPSRTSTPTPSVTPSNTPTASVSASNTPSGSVTPSGTPSASETATATLSVGALPSATGTPAATRTGTPTPTSTLTPRGGRAVPSDGFAVVVIGNGTLPIPNRAREMCSRAAVHVYANCASGCSAPELDRAITLPYRAFGDAYGNRAATLTTGSTGGRATFLTGRLVPSEDRAQLTLGLFDTYEGYFFGSKREPIVFTLAYTGFWRTFMPCAVLRTSSSGLIDDPYYW